MAEATTSHEVINYKGKRFFKSDFVHMIIDTMKLSDEEIASNKHLNDIGYKNKYNIENDPLGLRNTKGNNKK